MDRGVNTKIEKQTIYEIFRACRLCGAGGGYKMPIIQNVINLDGSDIELKQKIRECVQIEVNQEDKMPPLICELCVDKVNDFYEFLEMCRQTNKRTRQRLGLPSQSVPKLTRDPGVCVPGVTEPIYVNDDSNEPLVKQKPKSSKSTGKPIKKEMEVYIKIENATSIKKETQTSIKKEAPSTIKKEKRPLISKESQSRSSRSGKRPPSPQRSTRQSAQDKDKKTKSSSSGATNKKIKLRASACARAKRSLDALISQSDEESRPAPRAHKRLRERDATQKPTVPMKKVKIATPTPKLPARSTPKSPPKPTPKPPPPSQHTCKICSISFKSSQALSSHMRSHTVTYTNPRQACNACGKWFVSPEKATVHHLYHRARSQPYHCRRCTTDFKQQKAYNEHFDRNKCIPWEAVPDVQCKVCCRYFVTRTLRDQHRCPGEDGRPGGKCSKCSRNCTTLKMLRKHEASCTAKKKGELIVDPDVLKRLIPMQVRVARCDPLLKKVKQEYIDVSDVTTDYGLDKTFVYPYISSVGTLHIKTEPINEFDGMVNIKEEFNYEEDYVHWDSDCSSESDQDNPNLVLNPLASKKQVDSLSTLCLKIVFSPKLLGKVPRKRRKIKTEKESMFDSILNTTSEFNSVMRNDINDIIKNLENNDHNNDISMNSEEKSILNTSNDDSLDAFLENRHKNDKNIDTASSFDTLLLNDQGKTDKNMDLNEHKSKCKDMENDIELKDANEMDVDQQTNDTEDNIESKTTKYITNERNSEVEEQKDIVTEKMDEKKDIEQMGTQSSQIENNEDNEVLQYEDKSENMEVDLQNKQESHLFDKEINLNTVIDTQVDSPSIVKDIENEENFAEDSYCNGEVNKSMMKPHCTENIELCPEKSNENAIIINKEISRENDGKNNFNLKNESFVSNDKDCFDTLLRYDQGKTDEHIDKNSNFDTVVQNNKETMDTSEIVNKNEHTSECKDKMQNSKDNVLKEYEGNDVERKDSANEIDVDQHTKDMGDNIETNTIKYIADEGNSEVDKEKDIVKEKVNEKKDMEQMETQSSQIESNQDNKVLQYEDKTENMRVYPQNKQEADVIDKENLHNVIDTQLNSASIVNDVEKEQNCADDSFCNREVNQTKNINKTNCMKNEACPEKSDENATIANKEISHEHDGKININLKNESFKVSNVNNDKESEIMDRNNCRLDIAKDDNIEKDNLKDITDISSVENNEKSLILNIICNLEDKSNNEIINNDKESNNDAELDIIDNKQSDLNNDNALNDFDVSNDKISVHDVSNGDIQRSDNEKTCNTNGESTEKSRYKFNMNDLEDISDTEMDDKKLMEALDAQIAENRGNGSTDSTLNNSINDERDKIMLDDLLHNRDSDLKSMDLDSISDDDFNLDN